MWLSMRGYLHSLFVIFHGVFFYTALPAWHIVNMDKEVSGYFIGYHAGSAGCLATMFQCTICLATAYLESSECK